jgi:hypothetical protein
MGYQAGPSLSGPPDMQGYVLDMSQRSKLRFDATSLTGLTLGAKQAH